MHDLDVPKSCRAGEKARDPVGPQWILWQERIGVYSTESIISVPRVGTIEAKDVITLIDAGWI